MRVIHFADSHIGVTTHGILDKKTGINSRVTDFVNALRTVVDYSLNTNADLVVFAGDAFHTKKPHPTHQQMFVEQILRLSKESIPVVLLPGNHDMPATPGNFPAMHILSVAEVPHVYVPLVPTVYDIETKSGVCQVGCAPHPQWQKLLELESMRNQPKERLESIASELMLRDIQMMTGTLYAEVPHILLAHLTVSGVAESSEKNMLQGHDYIIDAVDIGDDEWGWDYVALGHIHRYQNLNPDGVPVVYSGSLGRVDFGEATEPKGFCDVHIVDNEKTTYEFVRMQSKQFTTFRIDSRYIDNPEDACVELEDIDVTDHIVRAGVQLRSDQESSAYRRHMQELWKDASVLSISVDVERKARQRVPEDSNISGISDMGLLKMWLDSKNEDQNDELMAMAREVMEA